MPTIYAHTNDGYVNKGDSDWATARDATTGGGVNSAISASSTAISSSRSAARGGGYNYTVSRVFMYFDTSGISSNVASATLNVRGYIQGGGDVVVVKATSDISSLATADFDAIDGWNPAGGRADGSGAGDNIDNVTVYSTGVNGQVTSWSTSGYEEISLTALALADLRDDDTVYIYILNYDYDILDIAPTGTNQNGLYFVNYTGTSRDPYIDYTLTPTTTDNSVFFGCNF